jgi:polysaccharide deacetylase 2 family uncharacterized protein YibQ
MSSSYARTGRGFAVAVGHPSATLAVLEGAAEAQRGVKLVNVSELAK